MGNTNRLSADPYEGAREAYRALNPTSTCEDWEAWLLRSAEGANGEFDNFSAFADLCNDCLGRIDGLNSDQVVFIGWAAGYFEAMRLVTEALIDMLPTSGRVPHHFTRYRSNLRKFPERYADEA